MRRALFVIAAAVTLLCACGDGSAPAETEAEAMETVVQAEETAAENSGGFWATANKLSEKKAPEIREDGIPSFGFCAVGEVDVENGLAAILAPNGIVVTRQYDGVAPVSGLVCAYETEGDYIAFTSVTLFPGFGAEYADWVFGAYASSRAIYYGKAYAATSDSVFFVRYGATSWRLFSGADAIKAEGDIVTGGYVYSADGNNIDFMLICGKCGEYEKLSPVSAAQSKIFDPAGRGWDDGDKTVKIAK